MDISFENLEKVNVGGENLYIAPNRESEEIIYNAATIENELPKYAEVLGGKWEVAKKDPLVKLAMQKSIYTRNHWMGLFVVLHEGAYRRVDLQIAKCHECDWEGWVATPLCFDLYIGRKNAKELFDEAKTLPVVSCPQCGGKLDKHAIWVAKRVTGSGYKMC